MSESRNVVVQRNQPADKFALFLCNALEEITNSASALTAAVDQLIENGITEADVCNRESFRRLCVVWLRLYHLERFLQYGQPHFVELTKGLYHLRKTFDYTPERKGVLYTVMSLHGIYEELDRYECVGTDAKLEEVQLKVGDLEPILLAVKNKLTAFYKKLVQASDKHEFELRPRGLKDEAKPTLYFKDSNICPLRPYEAWKLKKITTIQSNKKKEKLETKCDKTLSPVIHSSKKMRIVESPEEINDPEQDVMHALSEVISFCLYFYL